MPDPSSRTDLKSLILARLREHDHERSAELIEDVLDEVAQHLDDLYQAMRSAGRSEEESLAAVEAQLQHLPALAREARIRRRQRLPPAPEASTARPQVLSQFLRDLRHATRVLIAKPGFTAAAIVTLALGIGANTAIFSVVYSLLLAPLPFPDPERLVVIWETAIDNPRDLNIVSAPNWKDWRDSSTSFERVAIWESLAYNISGGAEPEQVVGMRVSASAFPMFGVAPQLGRTFTDAEDAPGHRVVVISDALWRRRFDGNPTAIGQMLRVNGQPHEVVGVMPRGFRFVDDRYHVWVPIAFNDTDAGRDSHSFLAAGRLKAGITFEAAVAEVEALGRRIDAQTHEGHGASLTRMSDFGVAELRPTLKALLGAVGFVLLIACVNVANLLLAQSTARRKEFIVRAALGASRARLAMQLLAEGALLALAGGAAGAAIAWAGTAALGTSLPGSITFAPFRSASTGLNLPALIFTAVIAAVTGVLFSLAPLIGIGRTDAGAVLKAGGDRGGTSRSTIARTVLVSAEVALAVIVLAAAGLMIKSVARLTSVETGLDPRNVLTMRVALPQVDFYGPPERTTFCADLQREVSALPGVRVVGAISQMPLTGAGASRGFEIEGRPPPDRDSAPGARYRITCPGYFQSLSIPVTRGRDFSPADTLTSMPVAIVSESAARLYWPDRDPIGTRVRIDSGAWMTVVGVVADVRQIRLDAVMPRILFRPYSQAAWPAMTVTVKTDVRPMSLSTSVPRALRRIDPEMPVSGLRTMEEVVTNSIGDRRFPMLLFSVFSLVALTLASVGVYGVVSYVVSLRTREIGIRVALGAPPRRVTRQIVRRSLLPIAGGLAAGVAGAVFASRLLEGMLYGVRGWDPIVLASITAILAAAALMASWIPARRAAALDPIAVLRQE